MQKMRFFIRKAVAFIACACFAATFLFLAWFIISHADHDCTGEHCPVCAQIQAAENLLKQIGLVSIVILFIFANLLNSYTFGWYITSFVSNITPITLKVRMNN